MKVLVVDDSMTMRKMIRNSIATIGITHDEIFEAEDGVEACDILEEEIFDLILTDWNMPKMDGLELVKVIRSTENLKKIPIIMVTTESNKEGIITALKAGVNDYFVKPFDPMKLSNKIKDIIK